MRIQLENDSRFYADLFRNVRQGSTSGHLDLGEREWLEKAAGAGYANAYTKLGQLERAAELGDAEAKMLLGRRRKDKHDAPV